MRAVRNGVRHRVELERALDTAQRDDGPRGGRGGIPSPQQWELCWTSSQLKYNTSTPNARAPPARH